MSSVSAKPQLTELLRSIATGNHEVSMKLLAYAPELAKAGEIRSKEFFLEERLVQIYEGDTALHAAGFSYDLKIGPVLLGLGADIRAKNRRGAEPLHAATIGNPDSVTWNPKNQRDVILLLVRSGADPNARASGGVTPLHRAVRNRCSAAVEALLSVGADPNLRNLGGSTALDLASVMSGRGGSGSAKAKAEQQIIKELLMGRKT